MDLKIIQIQLIRAIRGRYTQGQVNRKLLFKHNQISKWETGTIQPSWSDFLGLCKTVKIPIEEILKKAFFVKAIEPAIELIEYLKLDMTNKELIEVLQISRQTLTKWYNGKSEPKLIHILTLLFKNNFGFYELIDSLVGGQNVPEIYQFYSNLKKQKEFLYQYPEAEILLRIFDLEQPDLSIFNKLFGISTDHRDRLIKEMISLNLIRKGKGKYHVINNNINMTGDFKKNLKTKSFWYAKNAELLLRINSVPEYSAHGHLNLSVSKSALKEIRMLYMTFFHNIKSIAMNDNAPPTEVLNFVVQILNIREFSELID